MAIIGATGSLGGFAGGNALARLLVVFSGDTSSLDSAVARAQGTMSGFGANAANIGKALTRAVSLPILAVGGAALFMASQFESAIGRIAGLTTVVDQIGIDQIREDLLALAQEVPQTPKELADAMYFAGSAGLDAADAFQVVELSAKGAAIGMGDASDIARVLIAALNNFGKPAGGPLTAAAAMDALTAAIKVGTAEPEEMAIALGRVLPVAKAAGVTFEETVGSLAALTNIGLPARVATTSLRALFAELLAPTQQASARLDTLGLSAEKVRNVLQSFGPIAVFQLLEDAVHGDEDALRDILPQIRGFTAYLGLAQDRLGESKEAMEATTNSAGALQKAFDIISKTPAFKFEIGLNKMRVAAIDLGTVLFPVFDKIIQIVGDVGDALANLPGPVQVAAVAFSLLAAAVGPVLQLLGNMGALIAGPIGTLKQFSVSAIAAGIAVVTLVASFQSLASGSRSLYSVLITVVAGATAAFTALRLLQGAANLGVLGVNALSLGLVSLSTGGLAAAALAIGVLVAGIGLLIGQSGGAARAVAQMGEAMSSAARQGQLFRTAINNIEDEGVATRIRAIAQSLQLLNASVSTDTLGQLQEGIGTQLVGQLDRLSSSIERVNLGAVFSDEDLGRMGQFISLTRTAVASGQDLGPVFKQAGLEGDEFLSFLSRLGEVAPDEALRNQAVNVETLARSYATNLQVLKDYQNEQLATIQVQAASGVATEKYARELGVSTEFLQSRMDAVGVSALGMSDENKQAFEDMAFVADGTGEKITARLAEMQEAIAEASKNISDSISGAFAGFEKAEDDVKGTTATLLRNFEVNSQAIIEMTGNLRALADQGLPAGLLDQLAAEGPEMVKRFVDATPAQLKRLTAAYEAELAATDAAILDEANLQHGKGQSMVSKFVDGILTNSQLPAQAATRIVQDMVRRFSSGQVNAAGLQAALQFARGLGTVKGLSQNEAVQAMDAFIAGIGRRNLADIGQRQARELANGIAAATGITKAAANRLIQNTINALNEKKQEAHSSGDSLATKFREGVESRKGDAAAAGKGIATSASGGMRAGNSGALSTGISAGGAYVSGLASKADEAYRAGFAVSQAGNQGLKDGAQGSPQLFSWYLGRDIVDAYKDGVESRVHTIGKLNLRFPIGSNLEGRLADEGGGRRGNRGLDLDLDVTLDRTKAAKAMDWEYATRGR